MLSVGDNAFYKLAAKYVVVIVTALVSCRYFGAWAAVLIVLYGCTAGLSNRIAMSLSAFILLTFIMVFNPILIPKSGMLWGLTLRGGPILIGLCLAMTSQRRRGNYKIPVKMLGFYLIIAAICSIHGYAPTISYAKIIYFGLFLWVICETTKNLQTKPEELFKLRAFLFGLTALLVFGSLVSYPYPAISTLNGLRLLSNNPDADIGLANDDILSSRGMSLFVGLLNHSQALAGVVGCCFGWINCDMLFVERRFRWLHGILICLMPIIIFLTRSRIGLFIMVSFSLMFYFYTKSHITMTPMLKARIDRVLTGIVVIGIFVLVIGEVRNKTVSRWLRKTDNVAADDRGLSEAVISSRQGLINENMRDFHRNRLWGSGFQVAERHEERYKNAKGIIISAPIEKGILPLMVLGETGIIGATVFLFFLFDFFSHCFQMRLWSTMTLFVILLTSNMAEASFFSAGGIGGIQWCFTVVGGFICDSYIRFLQDTRSFPPPFRNREQ